MSKARIHVVLKPFILPNFVSIALPRSSPADPNEASVPVSEIDHAALDGLVRGWLDGLYKKAGKRNPFIMREGE